MTANDAFQNWLITAAVPWIVGVVGVFALAYVFISLYRNRYRK